MSEETTVTETRSGVTVNANVKRGSGTRDEDKVSLTAHFEDLKEARAMKDNVVLVAREYAEEVRSIQPVLKSNAED